MLANAKKFVGALVGLGAAVWVLKPMYEGHATDPAMVVGSAFGALVLILAYHLLVAPAIPE